MLKCARTTKTAPLSKTHPDITVEASVAWQLEDHIGFTHSFMSSIRFAPVTGQQATWKRLGLRPDKTLFFAGRTDPIIIPTELKSDAEALLGKEKVEWRLIDGAHDFPITDSARLVDEMCAFWGM
jgi:hypothetical protein